MQPLPNRERLPWPLATKLLKNPQVNGLINGDLIAGPKLIAVSSGAVIHIHSPHAPSWVYTHMYTLSMHQCVMHSDLVAE